MERSTCLIRILPGMENAWSAVLCSRADTWKQSAVALGAKNGSMWGICEFVFVYMEVPEGTSLAAWAVDVKRDIGGVAEMIALPGEMRLMYSDIGVVHEDKSEIRHRVFATLIHPGCDEEYKARHDRLSAGHAGRPARDHADSNFTIWCAQGRYNFGYCEKVRSFDHEMGDRERENTIAWETKMLEIMDWMTDDVDWITGEHHEKSKLLLQI